jgi:hypothetical protein
LKALASLDRPGAEKPRIHAAKPQRASALIESTPEAPAAGKPRHTAEASRAERGMARRRKCLIAGATLSSVEAH